jgi:cyclopropane fatty-acyl-phospholipid synthase-like methyltransferase
VLAHSDACERNKGPILAVLRGALAGCRTVLEVGSGTGQHAVYLAHHLPQLSWQPSERPDELGPLAERIRLEGSVNLLPPVELDVRRQPWPVGRFDAVFSANTLHIMGWEAVEDFFRGVGAVLGAPGVLCVYGPFRYRGGYTSDSNAAFDRWLSERDAASGIRDFEALDELAARCGLALAADHAMPANNQTLVWRRAA